MAKNGGIIAVVALLLIGAGIINLSGDSQASTQCNDGIDNNDSGIIDGNYSVVGFPMYGAECNYNTGTSTSPIWTYCPTWHDEATWVTQEDCNGSV
jgi:hypothetical protein